MKKLLTLGRIGLEEFCDRLTMVWEKGGGKMASYTLTELVAWGERIEELAREEGLNFYPQEFELCDYEDMLSYQAYNGMPSHYPHWSFGKAYDRLENPV